MGSITLSTSSINLNCVVRENMNDKNFELAGALIGTQYTTQAASARHQRENLIKILLSQRRLPDVGWDDQTIELFMSEISAMDTNNFVENVGVGEREGRLFSSIVRRRNFHLAHGVGRSGDLGEVQPKAAGSSLVYKLCNALTLDAIYTCGITRIKKCIVIPMATGMSMVLFYLNLRQTRPGAQFVIWPRIDQKTCLKSIQTACYVPVVIENKVDGDQIVTDLDAIRAAIIDRGHANIACLVSTTSCFAPRTCENVIAIAALAKEFNIPHLINNAYGLQSSKICHDINEAIRLGRVDAVVQSTDKNFMVPVGGAILASPSAVVVDEVAKTYSGRASGAPVLDLLLTLLGMGKLGLKSLLTERKEMYLYLRDKLTPIVASFGERILDTPGNPISLAISLSEVSKSCNKSPKEIGAILFHRCSSGVRVVDPKDKKQVCGIEFVGYGAHANEYPTPYLNVAAAIGMTKNEVDTFASRLEDTLRAVTKVASGKVS